MKMKTFSMVAQLAGLVAVTAGASLIFLPAGFIVGGACLVLVGFAFGMSKE
jgi:ammonia channel protein AmtB